MSSIGIDCRLRRSIVGCDDVVVVVVVGHGKAQLVLLQFASCDRTKRTRLVCTLAPRLRLWKRGALAPVVGEGVS